MGERKNIEKFEIKNIFFILIINNWGFIFLNYILPINELKNGPPILGLTIFTQIKFYKIFKNGGTGWLRSNYPCNVNAVLYY
jgi:hypothetical protein